MDNTQLKSSGYTTRDQQRMNAAKVKILLVDGEPLVREGLSALIDKIGTCSVLSAVSSTGAALRTLETERPDLLICEVALPGRSGVELLLEIARRGLKIPALVISSLDSEQVVRQALAAGASGYLLKRDSSEELLQALSAVLGGATYVSPKLSQSTTEVEVVASPLLDGSDPLSILSPREREIFHLLADGLQNSAIAKKLFISPRTVETHRARVVRKLGLHSNSELIRFAIKNGLSTV